GDDARVVVAAVTVEQHAGIALAQAQHAQQVGSGLFRQADARAGREGEADVGSGQAHVFGHGLRGSTRMKALEPATADGYRRSTTSSLRPIRVHPRNPWQRPSLTPSPPRSRNG